MINKHTAIGRRMLREMRRGTGRREQPPAVRGPSPLCEAFERMREDEWIEKMRAQVEPNKPYEGVTFRCDLLLDDDDMNCDGFSTLGRQLAEEWMERIVLKILSEPVNPLYSYTAASMARGNNATSGPSRMVPYDVVAHLLQHERDRVVDEGTVLQTKPPNFTDVVGADGYTVTRTYHYDVLREER